jgi:deoxycytidylate deaminase
MKARERLSWPRTAIKLAHTIAESRSEDPYLQVGAVAFKKDKSILVGYNGAPSGIEIDWSDRDHRRARVLHAEVNVLNYCKPGEVDFLACTHVPCPECIKMIAAKQVDTVFYSNEAENYPTEISADLAREFRITLLKLEDES